MTDIRETVKDVLGDSEDAIQRWVNTDRETWATLGGINLTGKAKAADMGYDIAERVSELSVEELMEFRYELRDHFLNSYDGDPDTVEKPIDSIVRGLVEIVEAEIGGRWVS